MSRPGGITVLAVFNFILGAMTGLGSLQFLFFVAAGDQMAENMEGNEQGSREIQGYLDIGTVGLLGLFALTALVGVTLIVAGIGYLKLKPILGWWMGMAYSVLSIGTMVIQTYMLEEVSLDTLSNLVYPVVTVLLLSTVFRRDFATDGGKVDRVEVPADHEPVAVSQGRIAHITLIAGSSIRFALRTGGGVIFLIVILFAGLSASQFTIKQAEVAVTNVGMQGSTGEKVEMVLESSEGLIEALTGAEDTEVEYLMRDHPALLSALFLIFLIITPFSSCIAGFNQTAGDIGTKGLRYLLLRTERSNIFIGRFVGTVLFSFAGMGCLLATVTLYVQFKLDIYEPLELWAWALQGWIALCILALPHMAICAWISGSSSGPFLSFAIGSMAVGFPLAGLAVIRGILETATSGDFAWLLSLIPWGWKYDLLSGDMGSRLVAILFMFGFTAFMLSIGYWRFRKRDL